MSDNVSQEEFNRLTQALADLTKLLHDVLREIHRVGPPPMNPSEPPDRPAISSGECSCRGRLV